MNNKIIETDDKIIIIILKHLVYPPPPQNFASVNCLQFLL